MYENPLSFSFALKALCLEVNKAEVLGEEVFHHLTWPFAALTCTFYYCLPFW